MASVIVKRNEPVFVLTLTEEEAAALDDLLFSREDNGGPLDSIYDVLSVEVAKFEEESDSE